MIETKYLCICNHGNVRAHCLAWILRNRGYETIALSFHKHSIETLGLVGDWCDKAFVMCEDVEDQKKLKDLFKEKFVYLDVGPDIWGHPFNPDLKELLEEKLQKFMVIK